MVKHFVLSCDPAKEQQVLLETISVHFPSNAANVGRLHDSPQKEGS